MLEKRNSAHQRSHQHLIPTIRIQVQRRKLYYAQENIEPSPNCVILGLFLHQKEIQKLQIRLEESSFPHRAQSEERNTGGGSIGFRISAMAGGPGGERDGKGEERGAWRCAQDDEEKSNSRPFRTRRSRPSSSTADENSPTRLHLLLPTDDEKPQSRP
jgi:hypothetical protein